MSKLLRYTISDISPDLESRIRDAREIAVRVHSGASDDHEEIQLSVIWFISRYYKIPIFSAYFQERTLDDLIFEAELIKLESTPRNEMTSNLLNDKKDEAAALFDDMIADEFQDVVPNKEQFDQDAINFMKTGNFKEQ
jgi:hypothetical protein